MKNEKGDDDDSDDSSDDSDAGVEPGEGFAIGPRPDSDGEGEATQLGLPYVVYNPEDEPMPEPKELTARQRKLRMLKNRTREAQRSSIAQQLTIMGEADCSRASLTSFAPTYPPPPAPIS